MALSSTLAIGSSLLGIGTSLIGGNQAARAANAAAAEQRQASNLARADARNQFNRTQALLRPFVNAGRSGLTQQLALAGLSGQEAEREAIGRITGGVQFQELTRQGEDAILSNAAATGGLRGGNTQSALAQFRPAILSSLIQQQFGQSGQIANLGQASAARSAAAGQQFGAISGDLRLQAGAANSGAALAAGQGRADQISQISQGIGGLIGAGGGNFGESSVFNPLFGGSGLGNFF